MSGIEGTISLVSSMYLHMEVDNRLYQPLTTMTDNVLSNFPFLKKKRVGLSDHHAVCVYVCPLI